jgi:glycine oxidase
VFADSGNKSDILIIGGGVIGMGLARELAKNGAGKVALIERGALGAEASSAAAGMLSPQAEAEERTPYFDLCYESRGLYDAFAADLEAETGIAVNLETSGTLNLSYTENDSKKLDKIYAWQQAAGFPVERLTREEILKLEPHISPAIREGLFFPRDAQVDNRRLVAALAASIKKFGVEVFENTRVTELLTENGKICGAQTDKGDFYAPMVVLATGAWTSFIKHPVTNSPLVDVKPVRGQMIAYQPGEKLFERVIYTSAGYAVPRIDGRILIGATVEDAGFEKLLTADGVDSLINCARMISPGFEGLEIADKWCGLRPRTTDNYPILGQYNDLGNLFVATAHYRNGILLAPLTAKLMCDLVLKNKRSVYLDNFGFRGLLNKVAA